MNTKPTAALTRSQMKSIRGGSPDYPPCPTEGQVCYVDAGGKQYQGTCVPHGSAQYCYCDAAGQPITLLCPNP